ncbi:hypothetical protein OG21DRAFT_1517806 [Imleria badia]|nr:hypothetical protein OG21DRAFT_1517806 [Imleria badia]
MALTRSALVAWYRALVCLHQMLPTTYSLSTEAAAYPPSSQEASHCGSAGIPKWLHHRYMSVLGYENNI